MGTASGESKYPTRVKGLTGKKVESIAVGGYHACAIISGGQEVYCWEKTTSLSWVLQHLAIEILPQ